MTTFTTQGSTYGAYDGRYLYLTITETVDKKNNKSTLAWSLTAAGGNSDYYSTGPTEVKINGTQVYYKARTDWSEGVFPAARGTATGTIDVAHDTNGTKTISVVFKTAVYAGTVADYGGSMTLTVIDRAPPVVSAEVTVLSSTSIKVKGTATKNCDKWEYSLNGGSNWIQYSSTNSTSQEKTLTSLTSGNYTNIKVRATRTDNGVPGTSSAVSADLTLPTVSFTVSNLTVSSVTINASSSVTADRWEYSTNNGSSWNQFSTTAGTSAAKTITGLSPNTTYQIKVRARKKSNDLYGTSAATSVRTLGGTALNSVDALTADESSPTLRLNWTVYNKNYTHSLTIRKDSTNIITITGLTGGAGTNNKTIALSSAQRASLLNAMSSVKEFTAIFVLTTYSGSSQIGTSSSVSGTVKTTSEQSRPVFTTISCSDSNPDTVAVTNDDQQYIEAKSSLQIVCTAATAKNGASIVKYRAAVGSKTVESSETTISFGAIQEAGDLSLTVSAIDSRGHETSVSQTLTVMEYRNISADSFDIRRENNVEETIHLRFDGSILPLLVDNVPKNAFMGARYRTKKASASQWSDYENITGVVSQTSGFTFEDDDWITLPADYDYHVQIVVSDKLSSDTVTLYVNKGYPLVAFRSERVGINTNSPQSALDVNGSIRMNGKTVQGYAGVLGSEDPLNTITNPGIYYANWENSTLTSSNYPCSKGGLLEVLAVNANLILQRYTSKSNILYFRTKVNGSWNEWERVITS